MCQTVTQMVVISTRTLRERNRKNKFLISQPKHMLSPGHVVQSVTCLATDGSLTADPGS